MLAMLTPAEAAALDRESAERGVGVSTLMENAGLAVARATVETAGGSYGRRAVVVCGKGNNGGDGLVSARVLERGGMGVSVVLLSDPAAFTGAAADAFRNFDAGGGRWLPFSPDTMSRELSRAVVVVDAIFGTGFRGAAEGPHAAAIHALNEAGLPVVAVDIPSGVEGESGAVHGEAVRARTTVTLGALKPGVVFSPGAELAGRVEVAGIGFPEGLVRSDLLLVEPADVGRALRPRPADSHKRSTGDVVVVAGSRGMPGAAVLAATAAYRSGAGLVTVAAVGEVVRLVRERLVEALTLALPETDEGSIDAWGWDALRERLEGAHAVAVGPGLTTNPSTRDLVHRLVRESPVPLVVDADGLNAFTGDGAALAERCSGAVVTPHAGEFARLTGVPAVEAAGDRVGHARKAAHEFGCAVLLKGPRTLVAEPGGRVTVNPTGGPSLATGGTGDVLTGAVAAFLARGLEPAVAAMCGAFVHGAAGDLAADELGEGTTAMDVAGRLPAAIAAVRAGGTT